MTILVLFLCNSKTLFVGTYKVINCTILCNHIFKIFRLILIFKLLNICTMKLFTLFYIEGGIDLKINNNNNIGNIMIGM